MHKLNVLIVEDSENDAELLLLELRRGGWDVSYQRVDTRQGMTTALSQRKWDLVIADYSLPQFSGTEALRLARASVVEIPFLLVSGTIGEETAVAAMKAGADDYLFKGDLHRLIPAVERELRGSEDRRKASDTKTLLHRREAQLAEALRLARLGTCHLNVKEHLFELSDEARSLLGLSPDLKSPTFDEFVDFLAPEDRQTLRKLLADPTVLNLSLDCNLARRQAQANFIHIRLNLTRELDGKLDCAVGMIQDITERKLIDAELIRLKDAAEAANLAKSEFLANMSHELRTPMTAILGFADMMSITGEHAIDPRECISTIQRNSHHLLDLINEVLDLSKIEAGQMKVERIRCDLPVLLSDVSALMRARAAEKSLQININIVNALPRYIQTDPLRLRQILVNLLGNAIKFTPQGSISLTVACDGGDCKHRFKIEVRDTGIGMTAEQVSRIFEPFAQAENSTTRKFGGTGLGLTISRRLARLLHGDITVSSEPGVGSVFTVMIDTGDINEKECFTSLDDFANPAGDSSFAPSKLAVSAKVLLAEDGRDNQKLLSTHLKMAGAEVEIVENGQLAVDRASENAFDLILMDMQMPVMDGYAATTELRKRGIKTPIIALTAYAMAEDRAKCLASGCTDYLSKPVAPDKLLGTIRRHLGQSTKSEHPMQEPVTQKSLVIAQADSTGPIRSTLMNYPGLANIINEFIADLPDIVQQLETLSRQHDMDRLRRLAHQLRGACGGFGFDCITDVAAKAEDAIRSSQPPLAISNSINSLIQIIRRVEGFDRKESRIAA
jgi:signal transduction histidine kinase/DNA-binding response OmpR family regulator